MFSSYLRAAVFTASNHGSYELLLRSKLDGHMVGYRTYKPLGWYNRVTYYFPKVQVKLTKLNTLPVSTGISGVAVRVE